MSMTIINTSEYERDRQERLEKAVKQLLVEFTATEIVAAVDYEMDKYLVEIAKGIRGQS